MALAHGTVITNNQSASSGPHGPTATQAITMGSNTCLIVVVSANRDLARATDFEATFDGVSMDKVVQYQNGGAADTYTDAAAFIIEGSWSGSKDVVVTFKDSQSPFGDINVDSWTIQLIPISGEKSGDLTGAVDGAPWTGTSTQGSRTQSVTTTADGSWHFMLYAPRDPVNHGPCTVSGGGTKIAESESASEGNAGALLCTAYEEVATAGSNSITITGSASDTMVAGGFELKADAGGGGGSATAAPAAAITGL